MKCEENECVGFEKLRRPWDLENIRAFPMIWAVAKLDEHIFIIMILRQCFVDISLICCSSILSARLRQPFHLFFFYSFRVCSSLTIQLKHGHIYRFSTKSSKKKKFQYKIVPTLLVFRCEKFQEFSFQNEIFILQYLKTIGYNFHHF